MPAVRNSRAQMTTLLNIHFVSFPKCFGHQAWQVARFQWQITGKILIRRFECLNVFAASSTCMGSYMKEKVWLDHRLISRTFQSRRPTLLLLPPRGFSETATPIYKKRLTIRIAQLTQSIQLIFHRIESSHVGWQMKN